LNELIELNKYPVKEVLPLLLKDKTTGKNIVFATDTYSKYGFYENDEITVGALFGFESCDIQPRVFKDQSEQTDRTRKKAEVFSPTWICNKMNSHCDSDWFGRVDVFNVTEGQMWNTVSECISFSDKKDWKKYVDSRRLEITCGEAPYIVSRYDATTGEPIDTKDRIGFLDRKLRVVSENTETEAEWIEWATRAVQSVYGYEFQGDNLLIARINVLISLCDYLKEKWGHEAKTDVLRKIANIISWNFWQMDGLTNSVPEFEKEEKFVQMALFDIEAEPESSEDKQLCKIQNWRKEAPLLFDDIQSKKRGKTMKFDYVIGNPPYQEESDSVSTTNGQKPMKNIFHYFQMQADVISKTGSVMIYPGGRWLHQSGKGLQQFGKQQINDLRLSAVELYKESKELFGNSADLSDGITIVSKKQNKTVPGFKYSYIDHEYRKELYVDNPGDDLLPLNPNDFTITNKIKAFVTDNNLNFLHDAILPRSLFSIESDFVEKNPSAVRVLNDDTILNYDREIKLFTNDKAGKAGRAKWFVADRSIIEKNQSFIDEWQVIVSSANAGGQKRDNQIEIVDNHSAFGRARVALRSFKTLQEAENFYKYCRSYIIRFAFLLTDEALTTLALDVPDLLDYSFENKLMDFSGDIDDQLYKLIGLDSDEYEYITKTVDNLR